MSQGFRRNQLFHRLMVGAGLSVFAFATVGAIEGRTIGSESRERSRLPDPETATIYCPSEMAAYANAVSALEAAQLSVDAAYEAWLDCEYGSGGGYRPSDDSHLLTETASILDQE